MSDDNSSKPFDAHIRCPPIADLPANVGVMFPANLRELAIIYMAVQVLRQGIKAMPDGLKDAVLKAGFDDKGMEKLVERINKAGKAACQAADVLADEKDDDDEPAENLAGLGVNMPKGKA